MIFDDADNIFEFFKGNFPLYTIALVPIFLVCSFSPVIAAHEFNVYRMQHYDLQGNPHGCRSSLINVEARTLSAGGGFTRKCILVPLTDLSPYQFTQLVNQGAAGVLIILPRDLTNLTQTEYQQILELEHSLLEEEIFIPVYLTPHSPQVEEIYRSIQALPSPGQGSSAAQELIGSVVANGYQLVVAGGQPTAFSDLQIPNIQGKLSGFGVEENLPTIAIVAHYDSYGLAPMLSYGADSNGSGVVALIELARLLSHLYTSSRTHPRFNLLFLLSGGGKFNYQGTRKWIEDSLDSSENSLLSESLYTLCLDTLGSGNVLHLHVSKPPREGTSGFTLLKDLTEIGAQHEVRVEMIHKKINLAEERRAWEHERFSMRRLPAFTLSRLPSFQQNRGSILDTRDKIDTVVLQRNIKIIAETLARQIYNISGPSTEVFTNGLSISQESISHWVDVLSQHPRPAQALVSPRHALILTLEQALSRYLKDVRVTTFRPDRREPELVFYEPLQTVMNAYKVKPAVFDLVLSLGIAAYLGLVYLFITNFFRLENLMRQFTSPPLKTKTF